MVWLVGRWVIDGSIGGGGRVVQAMLSLNGKGFFGGSIVDMQDNIIDCSF